MTTTFTKTITSEAQLRALIGEPNPRVVSKVIDHIDDGAAGFIGQSPFAVISTAGPGRCDASPRGGPPGFIRVLDRQHLAWGDLTGNNRLDSIGNILEQSEIGLVFMVPGVEETLRLWGSATLVRDGAILDACAIDDRRPKTAVVVTVHECYIQCGAALRRSGMWDVATWPAAGTRPSGAAILKAHIGTDESVEAIETGLADYYDNYIWEPGG